MPSRAYRQILASAPCGLHRRVLFELGAHVGFEQRVPRQALVRRLFGRVNSTTDRQARDAIADLQEAGCPILSDSGEGGYWLAATSREADPYLSEIESRIARLSAKRRGIVSGLARFFGPPPLF